MLMMILKRMMMAVPSLIGVVIVTFLLTRALPGDPAAYFAGPAATTEAIQQIRVKLGLGQAALHPVRPLRRAISRTAISATRSRPDSRSGRRSRPACRPPPSSPCSG